MQIAPPFGYAEVVPFLKTHKVRLLAAGEVPEFAQRGNAIPLSYSELQPAARDYPIVFTTGDGGKTFAAVAVLGVTAGENLFYEAGAWAPRVYVPAYARRYPFCMARIKVDQGERKDRLICVEKSRLDEAAGEAMFDAAGQPSEKWGTLERLLSEEEPHLADGALLNPHQVDALSGTLIALTSELQAANGVSSNGRPAAAEVAQR